MLEVRPEVSIIIPVFNREDLILETLNSIAKQSFQNWECLIIDDHSTDNSSLIIKEFCKEKHRFRFFERPSSLIKGANSCRNFGFELSVGKYIQWFDSDDIMLSDMLKKKVALIDKGYNCVISNAKVIGEVEDPKPIFSNNFYYDLITQQLRIETPKCLWRKSFLEGRNLFNESIQRIQDWEFNLRHFKEVDNFFFLNEATYLYRRHAKSITTLPNNEKQYEVNHTFITAFDGLEQGIRRDKEINTFFFFSVYKSIPILLELKKYNLAFKSFFFLLKINNSSSSIRIIPIAKVLLGILSFRIFRKGYWFFQVSNKA